MTIIEFLMSVVAVASIVLQSVVLLELRNLRHTIAARESQRRNWIREEHT